MIADAGLPRKPQVVLINADENRDAHRPTIIRVMAAGVSWFSFSTGEDGAKGVHERALLPPFPSVQISGCGDLAGYRTAVRAAKFSAWNFMISSPRFS